MVAYNHRGYAPSTVPAEAAGYSQGLLVEDLRQLLLRLGLGPVPGGCDGLPGGAPRRPAAADPPGTRETP